METAKPGFYFYGVCPNPDCKKHMPLEETPHPAESTVYKKREMTASCPSFGTRHTFKLDDIDVGYTDKETPA